MNARELYLAWLRTNYPLQYIAALRKITNKPRSLGGLGDDLTASFSSPDMSQIVSETQVSPDVTSAVNAAVSAQGSDSVFNSIANAVSNIATTYLQTSAQSRLLDINTQRARQGLAPLMANGMPVTAQTLAPANSTIYRLERSIAGSVGSNTLLFAGVGGLALFMLLGRRRRA
jgi:hypothetical protein